MYTPEQLRELAELRQKAVDGTYTKDDMRRFVLISRTGREASGSAAGSSTRKRTATAKKPVDVTAMMDSLKALMGTP